MTYTTVDPDGKKQTYEGFGSPYIKTCAHPRVLAVVHFLGQTDLWRIDPDNKDIALSELSRYYRAEYDENVRIAVFSRETIIESEP